MSYAPLWDGVVMVERPDPAKTPHVVLGEVPCRVRSCRSLALNGHRAIVTEMPLRMLQHYFKSQDEDHVFVRAELHGTHLQLGERCTLKEWVDTAHVSPNQA
jgi:hypothetical protein